MPSLLNALVSYTYGIPVALADTFQIKTGIPGQLDPANYGLLGYIQNGYLLALGLAGLLAFGSIVYGAFQYTVSRGNPSKLSDAWDRILQALIGIVLLVGAGTILRVINPGLLSLELPKLQPVADVDFSAETFSNPAPTPGSLSDKPGPGGTGKCTAITAFPDNPCSVAKLSQTCFSTVAQQASMVCNAESSANPINYNRGYTCEGGQPVVFGLFQINLKANKLVTPSGTINCPAAFEKAGGPAKCRVKNDALYQQCVTAAKTSAVSIATACVLHKNQRNANKWWDWEVVHPGYSCYGKV